jgi:hypothetical protein
LASLPVLILFCIPRKYDPVNWVIDKFAQMYITLMATVLFAIYFLDFGYYGYLDKWVNASVLQFLDHAFISTQMVWQSYPVFISGFAFLCCLNLTITLVRTQLNLVLQAPQPAFKIYQRIVGVFIFGC